MKKEKFIELSKDFSSKLYEAFSCAKCKTPLLTAFFSPESKCFHHFCFDCKNSLNEKNCPVCKEKIFGFEEAGENYKKMLEILFPRVHGIEEERKIKNEYNEYNFLIKSEDKINNNILNNNNNNMLNNNNNNDNINYPYYAQLLFKNTDDYNERKIQDIPLNFRFSPEDNNNIYEKITKYLKIQLQNQNIFVPSGFIFYNQVFQEMKLDTIKDIQAIPVKQGKKLIPYSIEKTPQ